MHGHIIHVQCVCTLNCGIVKSSQTVTCMCHMILAHVTCRRFLSSVSHLRCHMIVTWYLILLQCCGWFLMQILTTINIKFLFIRGYWTCQYYNIIHCSVACCFLVFPYTASVTYSSWTLSHILYQLCVGGHTH